MNFIPDTFVDGVAGNTPITAAKLNNLEQGVAAGDGTNPASAEAMHDGTTFVSYWAPATVYAAGKQVVSPTNDVVTAVTAHTSGSSFSPEKWSTANRLAVSVSSDMSQASIQSVLNGVASGTRVFFMPGAYPLAGPLTIAVDNTHIDARTATFVQTTWGQPAFDAIGRNGCLYDIGLVQFSGTRGGQGSSYRGSSQYCSGAGVWINGDNNFVRYLKTSYMPVGVFLSSYAGTSTYDHVGVGNRIGILESDHANWGLLYVGQQDLIVDDIYAHDDLDDSAGGNPTHVVYCSATTSFRSTGGEIRSARGKNIATGQPVQIKFHDNLRIGYINGTNCVGLLNVIDSHDLQVGGYSSLGTLANGGQGAVTFQRSVTNSQRPRLGKGYIQMAANVDERVFSIIADYGDFTDVLIDSNHSSSVNPASTGEILVRGTGNRLRRPTIRSLGAGSIPGIWAGFGELANNTFVEQPYVSGTLNVGKVDFSSTGVVFDYDSATQSFTGAAAIDLTGGNTVATTTAPPVTLSTLGEHGVLAFLVGSATPTIGAANSALQVRVTPRRNVTVTSLSWWSASASGNYDIGIVDDATNAVLWTKGSTAWPAAGKITETVSSIKLVAGRTYRLAFAADNVTGTLRGIQAPIAGLDQRLDGTTNSTTVSAAFPLPVSTLVGGTSGSTTRVPLIVVGGS